MTPPAPSENPPQSQSQLRPNLSAHHRSTSSVTSQQTDSPAGTPPATQHKTKGGQKHVVGHKHGYTHGRVSSSKSLHKLPRDKNNSSSNLVRKNSSQTGLKNLKRNRSSADVQDKDPASTRRPTSSDGTEGKKRPASVHFEIGDSTPGKAVDEGDWEEASSSASPAISRSASISAKQSAANSTTNSRSETPIPSPSQKSIASSNATGGKGATKQSTSSADAKVITEKLLQRGPSHHSTTTKMSLATATPTPLAGHTPSSSIDRAGAMGVKSLGPGTASGNQELISRFVGGSGTPGENSPKFNNVNHEALQSRTSANTNGNGELGRARSMGNLARHNDIEDEEESALLPRSRKSSTSGTPVPPNAYNSRTQQKLWLQRASSNIEPAREGGLGALSMLNGGGGGMGMTGSGLGLGNMYDGRDPRIKVQLERTGSEYLVVRRFQDPIGRGIKRLEKMGVVGGKHIPGKGLNGSALSRNGSLKERNGNTSRRSVLKQNYDDDRSGSGGDGDAKLNGEDEGIGALLRSLWDKNCDMGGSAD
ncbi:TORC1 subunit TCO89 domain-containing protein [Rutstroemia sp. NJR-2017a BVV2]|nr:TORC1 subunit TCO89 domain-containing protein [Rutstroemia sp. NJR-2017a BVV2]